MTKSAAPTFAAKRTPTHRGPAAWSAILPNQPAPQPLDSDSTADFAIIGAGFAGLSAAHRLRQLDPSAKIIVLEAGRLAEGASGRNSGFMIDLPHELTSDDYAGHGDDHATIAMNRSAIAFARGVADEFNIDANFFDQMGKVNGAATPKANALNRSYAAHLASLGEASQMLDAAQMAEMTGSRHYLSGLFTPGTVMLQPAGYIRAFGQGLRAAGVRICEQTPVTAFERKGQSWQLTTPSGRVCAGRVIMANNGHLESFGFAQNRLMHVFLYASMTVELDQEARARLGGAARWGITPSDPMGTTMRRIDAGQGGHRIITRTCATFAPLMQVSAAEIKRTAAVHRAKFDQRFPQLAGMAMAYSWAGHLCLTSNNVSVMRQLDKGLFAACVCNGLGTARSTLMGMAAAEMAIGRPSAIAAHLLAEDIPAKLPPRLLSTLGANAYLRWKEWRAAQE